MHINIIYVSIIYNMINMHLMSDRSIAIKKLTKEHNGYILRKYWEIELFVESYHLIKRFYRFLSILASNNLF